MLPFLVAPIASADEPVSWDWSRSHRFYLESQVKLPLVMWFAAPYNKEARVSAFELRVVTTCGPGEPGRTVEVVCTLDDVGLLASGLRQEEGLLDPIVAELDDILTGASVQLLVREDGRLVNVDLEDVERRNARFGAINENLRLVLSRAFAGLDLHLPDSAASGAWPQYGAWLMRTPSVDGSTGMSQIVHKIVSDDAGRIGILSAGEGMIVPGEGENKYDTRMSGRATFDTRTGVLIDRSWVIVGGPTASSHIAFGTAGYPYVQQGRVVALPGDETWDVGESGELPPGEAAQTAVQEGFLGALPNPVP